MLEPIYFNSYADREDYAVVKDEAFRLGITVKVHIANIITTYAKEKKGEKTGSTPERAEALAVETNKPKLESEKEKENG